VRPAAARVDHVLAQLLIGANRSEVDLGRFVAQHSHNDNVKGFAERMVKNHTEFINKLQQASGFAAAPQEGAPAGSVMQDQPQRQMRPPGQRTFAQPGTPGFRGDAPYGVPPQQRVTAYPPGTAAAPRLDFVQLAEQSRTERDNLLRSELERSKGADFDKAYLGQQILSNINMLAALRTFDTHASPQLKQVINQGIQDTQQHLDEARNLMAQLEQTPPQGQQQD
jgi:predicted outer membrane protein